MITNQWECLLIESFENWKVTLIYNDGFVTDYDLTKFWMFKVQVSNYSSFLVSHSQFQKRITYLKFSIWGQIQFFVRGVCGAETIVRYLFLIYF